MKERTVTTKKEIKKYKARLNDLKEGSQNYLVLKYILEHGSITPKEAEKKPVWCMRLSARAWDLKHKYGIPIQAETLSVKRHGKVRSFANYYIKEE